MLLTCFYFVKLVPLKHNNKKAMLLPLAVCDLFNMTERRLVLMVHSGIIRLLNSKYQLTDMSHTL